MLIHKTIADYFWMKNLHLWCTAYIKFIIKEYFVVNYSVSWQRKPWSDCAHIWAFAVCTSPSAPFKHGMVNIHVQERALLHFAAGSLPFEYSLKTLFLMTQRKYLFLHENTNVNIFPYSFSTLVKQLNRTIKGDTEWAINHGRAIYMGNTKRKCDFEYKRLSFCFTTHQPIWDILCRLPEIGRKGTQYRRGKREERTVQIQYYM